MKLVSGTSLSEQDLAYLRERKGKPLSERDLAEVAKTARMIARRSYDDGQRYQILIDELSALTQEIRKLTNNGWSKQDTISQFEGFIRRATNMVKECIDYQKKYLFGKRLKEEREVLCSRAYDFNRACLSAISTKDLEGVAL